MPCEKKCRTCFYPGFYLLFDWNLRLKVKFSLKSISTYPIDDSSISNPMLFDIIHVIFLKSLVSYNISLDVAYLMSDKNSHYSLFTYLLKYTFV